MRYGEYIQSEDIKYNMMMVAYSHLFINLRCCNTNNKVTYTKDDMHDINTKDIQNSNMTMNQNQEGMKILQSCYTDFVNNY